MDTGILGFFVLLAALAAGLVWVSRRRRRAEAVLVEAGFAPMAEIPQVLARALAATFGPEVAPIAQWGRSDGCWATDLLLETGDESSGSRVACSAAIPSADRDLLALSYTGAGPTTWLGRLGMRLTEAGAPDLMRRHRLTDENRALILDNRGFVAWSSASGDVTDLLPRPVLETLRASRSLEGFSVSSGMLIVWAPWGAVSGLLRLFTDLRSGFGPTPAR